MAIFTTLPPTNPMTDKDIALCYNGHVKLVLPNSPAWIHFMHMMYGWLKPGIHYLIHHVEPPSSMVGDPQPNAVARKLADMTQEEIEREMFGPEVDKIPPYSGKPLTDGGKAKPPAKPREPVSSRLDKYRNAAKPSKETATELPQKTRPKLKLVDTPVPNNVTPLRRPGKPPEPPQPVA